MHTKVSDLGGGLAGGARAGTYSMCMPTSGVCGRRTSSANVCVHVFLIVWCVCAQFVNAYTV